MAGAGHNYGTDIAGVRASAKAIRRNVIRQARSKGEGYVGQGLQAADIFATLFRRELIGLDRPVGDLSRDRFLLSVGHYGIALYATLAEIGAIPEELLDGYASDGSVLTMGTEPGHIPEVEFGGGSLGQGLGVAAGISWAMRYRNAPARVFNYMSDGELQEGATWEAAMFAGARNLGNLVNIIDVNRTQADGELVLEVEPLADKFRAFGWWVTEVNGNDVGSLFEAFDKARDAGALPKCLICHTTIAYGAPSISGQALSHFMRVSPDKWQSVLREVEEMA